MANTPVPRTRPKQRDLWGGFRKKRTSRSPANATRRTFGGYGNLGAPNFLRILDCTWVGGGAQKRVERKHNPRPTKTFWHTFVSE
eukprot:1473750-Amphidinium_carterae.1